MENLIEQSLLASGVPAVPAQEERAKLTSRHWIILLCLGMGQFCAAACMSLQAPFFPKEAEKKGATPTQYGFVFSVFELAIILSSPIFGKMMARCTPPFLVVSGEFVTGASAILFGLLDKAASGTPFISLAFAIRIVEGIGCAAFITSTFTVAALEFPNRVATTFSSLETCSGIGFIVGPTIGGLLYEVGGYFAPFAVMGGLLLIGSCVSFFLLPSTESKENETGNMLALLSDFGIILDALAIISSLLFIGYYAATLEPHLRQFQLSPALVGVIFVIIGSVYGLTTPLWGWLCDRGFDPKLLCIFGYACQCINLLFIGPVSFIPIKATLWLVILSLLIGGLGMSAKILCAFISALKGTQARGFPNDTVTNGMVSAIFASSCSIGAFIGPTIGGILLQYIGFQHGTEILLAVEIILMLLAGVYSFVIKRRLLNRKEDKNPLLL